MSQSLFILRFSLAFPTLLVVFDVKMLWNNHKNRKHCNNFFKVKTSFLLLHCNTNSEHFFYNPRNASRFRECWWINALDWLPMKKNHLIHISTQRKWFIKTLLRLISFRTWSRRKKNIKKYSNKNQIMFEFNFRKIKITCVTIKYIFFLSLDACDCCIDNAGKPVLALGGNVKTKSVNIVGEKITRLQNENFHSYFYPINWD